jgi:uncharacterized protein YbaR (Trm112 family)
VEAGVVTLDEALLALLVCPACRGELEPEPDGAALACRGCGRRYQVREGTPILLADDAPD